MSIDYNWMHKIPICIAGHSIQKYKLDNYKEMIKKISKDCEVVSFGIHTERPSEYYDNFVYISDPNDIYQNMVTLFDRLIRNG